MLVCLNSLNASIVRKISFHWKTYFRNLPSHSIPLLFIHCQKKKSNDLDLTENVLQQTLQCSTANSYCCLPLYIFIIPNICQRSCAVFITQTLNIDIHCISSANHGQRNCLWKCLFKLASKQISVDVTVLVVMILISNARFLSK